MDGIISLANGSSSTLYGCIGCAVKDMIISKFPENYFKYTSVSSELATRNIRRTFGGNNSRVEIAKRQKPYLIIQPTYSVMDQDGPLQNIPLTRNFDDLQYRVDKRYLFEIIRDKKYGYNLKFKLNRDRIEFDVTVTTSTLHQQLDIYRTILNQIIWDRSYSFRMALEAVIPKKMIGIISKYCNMDIEEHDEYIPILLKRLNSCSGYPITYKMRNASATDEWFMYYTHNVITTFSDLSIESGNKKNMVDDSYNITFRVTAEFNMPGVFVIDGNLNQLAGIDISLKTKEYQEENDAYFPLYTVKNLYSRFPAEMNGMQLYGSTIFQTTAKPNQLEDRIDIKCVLDNNHIRVIRAHKAWNMKPETLMNIYILQNGNMLTYGKDYEIDWNTLEIVIKTIDNTATYRLIMYFNYGTVNEILNNTAYEKNFDVNKPRENKFPDKGIEKDKVFVHSSITDTESLTDNELEKDPTYCNEGINVRDIDPDVILFNNQVIVNNDDDRFKKASKSMYLPDNIDKKNPNPVIIEDDPTYCADGPHETVDAESIIFNNVVIINNDDDDFRKPASNTFMKGYVPRNKIGDPKVAVVDDDPTYCADDEHEYIDPEFVIDKNAIILRNNEDNFKQRIDNTYLKGHVPEYDKDDTDNTIIEDDPTYCAEDEHEYVDPEFVIDKNAVIIRNDKEDYKLRSTDIYLKGHVPEYDKNDPNNVILEDDPTYCSPNSHELSLSSIETVGMIETTTVADIHNSAISTKKKFSSSI